MKDYPQKPTHTHFSEAEMMPRKEIPITRYIHGLDYYAIDIGDSTTHYFTKEEMIKALKEFLTKRENHVQAPIDIHNA